MSILAADKMQFGSADSRVWALAGAAAGGAVAYLAFASALKQAQDAALAEKAKAKKAAEELKKERTKLCENRGKDVRTTAWEEILTPSEQEVRVA